MATVRIYTKSWCGYCHRAKALLQRKGISFDEIDVTFDREREQEMIRVSGRRTVPQVFIGSTHVGGSDDLIALDGSGQLDRMLADDGTSP